MFCVKDSTVFIQLLLHLLWNVHEIKLSLVPVTAGILTELPLLFVVSQVINMGVPECYYSLKRFISLMSLGQLH